MNSNRAFFNVSMLVIVETIEQTVEGVNNGSITRVPSLPSIKTPLHETERIALLDLTGQHDDIIEEFEDVLSSIESTTEHFNMITMLSTDEVLNANHAIINADNAHAEVAQPIIMVQFLSIFEMQFDIKPLDVAFEITGPVVLSGEFFHLFKSIFITTKNKPTTLKELSTMYVYIIRSTTCNDIIISKQCSKGDRRKQCDSSLT